MTKLFIGLSFMLTLGTLSAQEALFDFESVKVNTVKPTAFEAYDCSYQKADESSEEDNITELDNRLLFAYTHPQYTKFMDDKYLLKCYSHLARAEDNYFLILSFEINSMNAKRSFGDIESGVKMKLFFDNDQHIYLTSVEHDRGHLDRINKKTLYEAVLHIDKKDLKAIQKHNSMRLGFIWEEGYQEYAIQNIDLIKNQLNCLNEK